MNKRTLVSLLLLLFFAGHLVSLATDHQHWPFLVYPMYSHRLGPTVSCLATVGVDDKGQETVLLDDDLYPFDHMWSSRAYAFMLRRPDGAAEVQTALRDVLDRHQRLRREQPALSPVEMSGGVRLYEVVYPLDPATMDPQHPKSKRLIAEVMR